MAMILSPTQPNNSSMEQRYEIHKTEVLANRRPAYQLPHKKQVGRGKGTFLERDLFESDAFWALKGAAPQMLIYLLGKRSFKRNRQGCYCEEARELTLSYAELKN
jgi:hypothetical protein